MALSLKFKLFNYVSYYNGAYENAGSLLARDATKVCLACPEM